MSWRNTTLKEVLKYLVPEANIIECPDVTLSPFRLDNVTVAKALQTLKDEYLLTVYYRFDKLFVGLPYLEKGLGEVVYHMQKNVPSASEQGELTFKRKEDLKLKVKAISIMPDNTRIEKEFGDSDGDSTTLHFYNKKESELEALAKEQINRMKYNGYKGSLNAFGRPFTMHGMIANLEDDKFPERQSAVFIDRVLVEYNSSTGYKRKNELGRKVLNG